MGLSPEAIVSQIPSIPLPDVHAALAYYYDHRAEIREEREETAELRREHGSQLEAKLKSPPIREAS